MSEENIGFFISRLSVKGKAKQDAELLFTDGLNVVSGASDTGKSFALSCIDFCFGASSLPRAIPESAGYEIISLLLTNRINNEQIIIERSLAGGNVRLSKLGRDGHITEEAEIPFKHNPNDANTLSGILLQLSGLEARQIRKNARGERKSLSFRYVAYLCVVDEERIISERSPYLSDSPIERTAESEAFRLLINGEESGEVIVVAGKKDIARIDAKIEIIAEMIEDAELDFRKTGLQQNEIEKELFVLEKTHQKAVEEYEITRYGINELERKLKKYSNDLREVLARIDVADGLIKRFTLLDAHYASNINRLTAIQETGSLLESLPSQQCPVCGAPPDAHRAETGNELFQPELIRNAAFMEYNKIKILREDLSRVITDIEIKKLQLTASSEKISDEIDKTQQQIDNRLTPRILSSARKLNSQTVRRNELQSFIAIKENILRLQQQTLDLEATKKAARSSTPSISSTPTTSEMELFAMTVENILKEWKYPNVGRVVFSESNQDLIVGGIPRSSHGKGVRALSCAAFILGIMKHCNVQKLPHPSVVVLDSPLVAYKEPDAEGSEIQKLRQAGVKEAFYGSLASNLASGQVIVFENEDPPQEFDGKYTRHHFTKSDIGRYGFFPVK